MNLLHPEESLFVQTRRSVAVLDPMRFLLLLLIVIGPGDEVSSASVRQRHN